ncbi:MAG: DegQ family serine endoprotease [Acidobacteria bacterium]|nr:DegQ family serine endoprotease [Acidobacteriota bacterium]MCA1627114.1 DegQ family serine endoprotease [Acidobacteriota bacterium]
MSNSRPFRGASSRVNLLFSLALIVFSFGLVHAQTSYADLVSRVSPAVVTIRSTERARPAQQFPFMDDPQFREFFGDRLPQQQNPRPVQGVGSGVIINSEGYILTNHHVVDGALEIRVELTDNRWYTAKLVGSDPPSDLAVLKIDARNLPTVTMGDSDKVRVGDPVLALGNPMGIGQTVTSGIVSAKGRSTGLSDGSFEDFLQTDAAINRGSSGGALVNTNGELIGINSQILSPSGGNIGIGFAIPSNMAKAVMDQLLKTGKVRRGMMGVTIQPIDSDLASSLSLPAARGAIITSVQPGGPAERAGIQRGDVVTSINNQPVVDHNSLRNQIAGMTPGSTANVTVVRNGREQNMQVALTELPDRQRPETEESSSGNGAGTNDRFGLSLQPLTAEMASRYGLEADDQGLLVTRVDPASNAATAGIRQGDLIQEVNRQPVRSIVGFTTAMRASGSRPALILIKRRNNVLYLTLRSGS